MLLRRALTPPGRSSIRLSSRSLPVLSVKYLELCALTSGLSATRTLCTPSRTALARVHTATHTSLKQMLLQFARLLRRDLRRRLRARWLCVCGQGRRDGSAAGRDRCPRPAATAATAATTCPCGAAATAGRRAAIWRGGSGGVLRARRLRRGLFGRRLGRRCGLVRHALLPRRRLRRRRLSPILWGTQIQVDRPEQLRL